MRKDTFWFSHDYNSRTDGKVLKLRMKHGMEGLGVYWCIVEMLYEDNGFISLEDYERITFELRSNEILVRSVINDFGLFEVNGERFWSNSVIERLGVRKDKSEQARNAINVRWEMERKRKSLIINKENTDVLQSNNGSNTIEDNKEKIGEETNGEIGQMNLEKKEDMVVQDMMKIWMKHKPRYPKDEQKDFHALLQLAYKIAEHKGWKRAEVLDKKKDMLLQSWEKIVEFVVLDGWYGSKAISVICSQWQSVYEQMENKRLGVGKKEQPIKIKLK